MRYFATVFLWTILMMGTVPGTGVAQEARAHPTIKIDERMTSTLAGDDTMTYAIALERGQSVVVQLTSDERLSWRAASATDGRVLNGVYDEMTRVVAPVTGSYLIKIQNPNDRSVAFSLALLPVEQASIQPDGIPYLLEDAPPILELSFEGQAGQFIRIEPESVAFDLEVVDDKGVGSTIVPGPVAMISFDIGVVLPEDGHYRLVVEPEIGMDTFSEESTITITEPEPLTGEIDVGQTIDGEADQTLVEYVVELDQYQSIRVTVETDDGSQVFVYDADDNPVDFGVWHGMGAPATAVTEMMAPEAGDYTIRIVNPITYDLFDRAFSLTVEELEDMALSPAPQTVMLGKDAVLLSTDVDAGQSYQLTITDLSDDERRVRFWLYKLPRDLLLSEDIRGTDLLEYTVEAESAGKLVLVLEGANRFDVPLSVTFEPIDTETP